MIKVLDVERRLPDGSIRVHLIADSTSDTLPTNCEQVIGLGVDYPIGIGSSCITASLDIALVGANGVNGSNERLFNTGDCDESA